MDEDQLEQPSSICSNMLHEVAVTQEDLDSTKDATKDGDTCTSVFPKDSCLPVALKQLDGSKSKQRPYLGGLPPAYLLPYLVLIKNCVHLPLSTIRMQCLTGETLCRIDALMLRLRKKKPMASLEPAKIQTTEASKYVTFDGLEDLQWKLFKGLLKRKQKTVGVWREVNYSKAPAATLIPEAKEHILPLIPKDWLVDDSLKFSEEMVLFLLQAE